MKKLVLFAACAAVLVLSSCSNKAKEESAQPTGTEEVAAPQPETTPEVAPIDSAAEVASDTTVTVQ